MMPLINRTLRVVPSFILLLSLTSACTKDASGTDAKGGASQQGKPTGGGEGAASGAAAGGGKGGAGGRTAPSITLASTDIATVAPATIEDGVALTGDLRPSETIDVRSRIEGDLE